MIWRADERDLVLLGGSATVAQVVLVREAMAALGGSELAWGAVFAAWLLGVALGAWLGTRWHLGPPGWAPVTTLVAALAGCLLLRAGPALRGTALGEITTTVSDPWVWLAATVPAAVCIGQAFPLLAHAGGDAGRAYALESSGAVIGGLAFTLLLAARSSITALAFAGATVVLVRGRRASLGWRGLLALGLAAAGTTAAAPFERLSWRWSALPGSLAEWRESRQQRLWLGDGEPRSLYGNGRLIATYPDPYRTSPAAHLMLLLHPRPSRVLAVGALADGSITTMLRHPLDRLTLVEPDPALTAVLPRWYGSGFDRALGDPRVEVASPDLTRALAAAAPLDLILILGPGPTTLRTNRPWTVEALAACRRALADDGVLVLRLPLSDTYLGGESGALAGSLWATAGRVFPRVEALPGESILLLASNDDAAPATDADGLTERWRERGLVDDHFRPELIPVLLDPGRAEELAATLATLPGAINSARRPGAVLAASALEEAHGRAGLLPVHRALARHLGWLAAVAAAALLGLLAATARSRRGTMVTSAAVVGAGSMTWWLILLDAWQSRFGSVYAELGALSALFMAGVALGAWQRWPLGPTRLLLLAAAVSAVLASPATGLAPVVTIPLLLAVSGGLTGAAFPALAAACPASSVRRRAGGLFSADETGAAAAALVVGVVALPALGVAVTGAALAAAQLATAVRLSRVPPLSSSPVRTRESDPADTASCP